MAKERTLEEAIEFIKKYDKARNTVERIPIWTEVWIDKDYQAKVDFRHRPSIAATAMVMEVVIGLGKTFSLRPCK